MAKVTLFKHLFLHKCFFFLVKTSFFALLVCLVSSLSVLNVYGKVVKLKVLIQFSLALILINTSLILMQKYSIVFFYFNAQVYKVIPVLLLMQSL
jgi:hypothetical protein